MKKRNLLSRGEGKKERKDGKAKWKVHPNSHRVCVEEWKKEEKWLSPVILAFVRRISMTHWLIHSLLFLSGVFQLHLTCRQLWLSLLSLPLFIIWSVWRCSFPCKSSSVNRERTSEVKVLTRQATKEEEKEQWKRTHENLYYRRLHLFRWSWSELCHLFHFRVLCTVFYE